MDTRFKEPEHECYATLKRDFTYKGKQLPAGTEVEVLETDDPERTRAYYRGLDGRHGHFSFWIRREFLLLYNQ